jgi:hypothetical protein
MKIEVQFSETQRSAYELNNKAIVQDLVDMILQDKPEYKDICLSFESNPIQPAFSLASYNIKDGSVLGVSLLVFKPRKYDSTEPPVHAARQAAPVSEMRMAGRIRPFTTKDKNDPDAVEY